MNGSDLDLPRLSSGRVLAAPELRGTPAGSGQVGGGRLFLVVDNPSVSRAEAARQQLDPNSPEITQLILSLGKSLNW
jgi:hypothetical protein